MKRKHARARRLSTLGVLIAVAGFSAHILTAESKIRVADLPEPAADAIRNAAGENRVNKVERETRDGAEVYEAEWRTSSGETSVTVDATGKLLDTEVEIRPEDLPAEVRDAALKAAPGLKIKEAERIDRGGRLLFEVEGRANGKGVELLIDAKSLAVERDDD